MVAAPHADNFLFWPTLVSLGIPATHVVIRATPLGAELGYVLLGMPLLAMAWVGFGVAGVVMLTRSVMSKTARRALSWLPVCLVVGMGASQLDTVRRYTNLTGDLLHFAFMYPYYRSVIGEFPHGGEPKLLVFNFGGMIWASRGIVYDESGEIEKPEGQQSDAWKLRATYTELGCGGYSYTPLTQHFYIADFPC